MFNGLGYAAWRMYLDEDRERALQALRDGTDAFSNVRTAAGSGTGPNFNVNSNPNAQNTTGGDCAHANTGEDAVRQDAQLVSVALIILFGYLIASASLVVLCSA